MTKSSMKWVRLPPQVASIYKAAEELGRKYEKYGRKFTPDGHFVGSIGEVVAARALGLTLHKTSHPECDAYETNDKKKRGVQIKMTAGKSVAMYNRCPRLVVLLIASTRKKAEIVYDGSGIRAWNAARKAGKNGQRVVSLKKLRDLATKFS